MINVLFIFLTLIIFSNQSFAKQIVNPQKMYFCLAVDEQFYKYAVETIGGLHKFNYDEIVAIAVFDLGLTSAQRKVLNTIDKVTVYDIERTHPDILKPFVVRNPNTKNEIKARGWYAWKPVVIKQALDLFPYVLYLDSRIAPNRPLQPIFEHMNNEGCYLITCNHDIKWMTTQYIIKKFDLTSPNRKFILDKSTHGLSAGLQGLTRDLYNSYVMPMYELAKDLRNFTDDGTTPEGFGTCRHDQPLFSIYARLLNLPILKNGNLINAETSKFSKSSGSFFLFKNNQLSKLPMFLHYKKTKQINENILLN